MSLALQRGAAAHRPASIPARMADFIISQTAATGSVTRDDLRLDYTDAEINEHFEQAKKLARRNGKASRQ